MKRAVRNNQRAVCCDFCHGFPEKSTLDMQLEWCNTENPNLQWFCQDCKQSTGSSPFLDNREVARNSCAVSAPSRLTREGLLAVFSVVVVLNYGENDCSDSNPSERQPSDVFSSVNNCLSVHLCVNYAGLEGKLPEICKLLQNSCLDILAVTETELENAFYNNCPNSRALIGS